MAGKSLVIIIPRAICDMFNLKDGCLVEIELLLKFNEGKM